MAIFILEDSFSKHVGRFKYFKYLFNLKHCEKQLSKNIRIGDSSTYGKWARYGSKYLQYMLYVRLLIFLNFIYY